MARANKRITAGRPAVKDNRPSFLLDADFYHDLKFLQIKADCGFEGVGVCVATIGLLRRSDGFRFPQDAALIAAAIGCSPDAAAQAITSGLEHGLFDVDDRSHLFAPGLDQRMKSYLTKISKAREAATRRWQLAKGNQQDESGSSALQSHCVGNADAMLTSNHQSPITNTNKRSSKKGDRGKQITADDLQQLELPTKLDTPEVRAALVEWVDWKAERSQAYRSLTGIKKLLTVAAASGVDAGLFAFAVNFSMARGWQGVGFYAEVREAYAEARGHADWEELKRKEGL